MSIISSTDMHFAIAELNKTNNIFRIKSKDNPISDENLLKIVDGLNAGELIFGQLSLYQAFRSNSLFNLKMENIDLIKVQLIYQQLEKEINNYFKPNCSYKISESASILKSIKQWKTKDSFVFLGDVAQFFSSIKHNQVFSALKFYKVSRNVSRLIKSFLNQFEKSKRNLDVDLPFETGLPVGNKLSILLAHLVLMKVDDHFIDTLNVNHYARFIDDFYISTSDEANINKYYQHWQLMLNELDLIQNEDKTSIVDASNNISYLGHDL